MLKYIPEAVAAISILLTVACVLVWASIIDTSVRSGRPVMPTKIISAR